MKKSKRELKQDTVISDTIHIGIELELFKKISDGEGCHDDDACYEERISNARENLENDSTESILREYMFLTREEASTIAPYFNISQWIDDYISEYEPDPCDYDDCSYRTGGDCDRDEYAQSLKDLTGNRSFKVVSDSSIKHSGDEIDTEVCWNYYISKDTVKDNTKILNWLKENEFDFNTSCGLHINLNNYLKIDCDIPMPTESLDFLFNFVALSRRENNYCSRSGMNSNQKYSMIYEQGDRLEFRFFSPTLDVEKLNNYVTLAHTVYKRLAGLNAKLPKKVAEYFLDKMVKVNNVSEVIAKESIDKVNNLISYKQYKTSLMKVQDNSTELTQSELTLNNIGVNMILSSEQISLVDQNNTIVNNGDSNLWNVPIQNFEPVPADLPRFIPDYRDCPHSLRLENVNHNRLEAIRALNSENEDTRRFAERYLQYNFVFAVNSEKNVSNV